MSTGEIQKLIIGYFKAEINQLIKRFSEKRRIVYILEKRPIHFKGFTPILRSNWTEKEIKFTFFLKKITEDYQNSKFREYGIDFNKLMVQLAHHEYGHVLSAETSKKLNSIHEIASKSEKSLHKISLKRLIINLSEFIADFNVLKIIDDNPPKDLLFRSKIHLESAKPALKNKRIFTLEENRRYTPYDKGYDKIFVIFNETKNFFLFDKWGDLEFFFQDLKVSKFLDFLSYLNSFYFKIIENNSNLIAMRDDFIYISKYLDLLNYKKIIIENKINKKDSKNLLTIIKYLKAKGYR